MTDISLHDVSIEGIKYDGDTRTLIIMAKSEESKSYTILFKSIFEWILSPFEMQNILFSITKYDAIPSWMTDMYEITFTPPEDTLVYYLDSSYGMGGVIFSKSMQVINDL